MRRRERSIETTPSLLGCPQNPLERDVAGSMFIVGQIPDQIAAHTASDIVLSAFGHHVAIFTGVMKFSSA